MKKHDYNPIMKSYTAALESKSFVVSGDTIRYKPDNDAMERAISRLPGFQNKLVTGTHEVFQKDGKWFAKFADGFVSRFGKSSKDEAIKIVKEMLHGILGNIV